MTNGIWPDLKELLALRYYASSIDLFNRQKVNQTTSGNNLSYSRRRGMDFEEVRRYQAGDDIRLIHWPLTARLGKPYTKIYKEERERAVYLLIDQSISMNFGTRVCFKNVLAAKLAAVLGFAALGGNDQIGGMVFNDEYSEFIAPKRSRKSLLDIFNLLTTPNSLKSYQGGLTNTLKFLLPRLHTGSIIIVISDYCLADTDTDTYLKLIAQKSQVINLFVYDNLEEKLPGIGQFNFTDTGKNHLEISSGKKNNTLYAKEFSSRLDRIEHLSRKHNMQFIKLATNDDMVRQINHSLKGIK
jgi:uncharacterized protein (DUF58 family)